MSANLKNNFLQNKKTKKTMHHRSRSKANKSASYLSHGFNGGRGARPKTSTMNDFRAYTRYQPELQNPIQPPSVPVSNTPTSTNYSSFTKRPVSCRLHGNLDHLKSEDLEAHYRAHEQIALDEVKAMVKENKSALNATYTKPPIKKTRMRNPMGISDDNYMLGLEMKGVIKFNKNDLLELKKV